MGKTDTARPITNLRDPAWLQQPRESGKAYLYFCLYRDMGVERSIKAVAEETGKSYPQLTRKITSRWRWADRADAFDKHMESVRLAAFEKETAQMAQRQAQLGMRLQMKAAEGLEQLAWDEDNPVTARDVVQLADAGVKIERTARGEKEQVATQVVIELPQLPGWAKSSPLLVQRAQQQEDGSLLLPPAREESDLSCLPRQD